MAKIYIFTHIPKTAGTTLRYHFQKYLKDQETFIHFANKGDKQAKALGVKPFKERSLNDRLRARVILGHNVDKNTKLLIGTNDPFEVVFFRDPLKWEISRYNQYANSRNIKGDSFLPFIHWYEQEKIHSQFDWLFKNYFKQSNESNSLDDKYQTVVQSIKHYSHVGFVDKIDSDMTAIFKSLEIPSIMKPENVTGKFRKVNFFDQNPGNYTLLEELLSLEIELFSKIKKNLTDN